MQKLAETQEMAVRVTVCGLGEGSGNGVVCQTRPFHLAATGLRTFGGEATAVQSCDDTQDTLLRWLPPAVIVHPALVHVSAWMPTATHDEPEPQETL